jgi:hypothetical protein
MASDRDLSDPICSDCSKPIRPGSPTILVRGQIVHVACRNRQLQLESVEAVDRAQAALRRANELVGETRRIRTSQQSRMARRPCFLCGETAIVIDWRPSLDWASVEDCACGGFFVWTVLLDGRLGQLSPDERGRLQARIRGLRALRRETWLYTGDGTPHGAQAVRSDRPE